MNDQRLVLPNSADAFYVEEMRQRLADGDTVRMAFAGFSMLPLINGNSDYLLLEPLPPELHPGDIYLFVFDNRCVIHRLRRVDNDGLLFQGDNNKSQEHVKRADVLARLAAVEHHDGSVTSCDSFGWRLRSWSVLLRRSLSSSLRRLFSRPQRVWMRWLYFPLLLILMWAPVGGLGVPLDNFVLGIRLDHLLHASVYVPCPLFLMDFAFLSRRRTRLGFPVWLFAALVAITTESVQYLLPYRRFDINDLVANIFGITLGWLIVRFMKK